MENNCAYGLQDSLYATLTNDKINRENLHELKMQANPLNFKHLCLLTKMANDQPSQAPIKIDDKRWLT